MPRYDFANILFAGPCNRFCPFCIGKQVPDSVNAYNLDIFPPRNWQSFVREVNDREIGEVVFTGTTTDPHLYAYEEELIALVRRDMPGIRLSIHTNGALSLRKMRVFNMYDRACISLPTFDKQTYAHMMGSSKVPDLAGILVAAKIPVKVSCVVNEHNAHQVDEFLQQLAALSLKRAVLRRLFGDRREFPVLHRHTPASYYRGNPVYNINGMEVTYWNFDTTSSRSINLFADGTIGLDYLLVREFDRLAASEPFNPLLNVPIPEV